MPEDFRILVTNTPNCMRLLKYIDSNVENIVRSTRHYVDIIKIDLDAIDEDTNKLLKSKGITGLPVMIAPNKKIIPGAARIIQIFDGQTSRRASSRPNNADMGSNPDLMSFYANEMFTIKNGALEKREDSDGGDEEDVRAEIERKMRNYQQPSHRGTGQSAQKGRSALDEIAADVLGDDYEEEDNIGTPTDLSNRYGSQKGPAPKGAAKSASDMDNQILDAYLNNLG